MRTFRGADLHCHSVFSDGVERPAALVKRALDAGLSALALSDHDAVHGLPEFEAAAKGTGLVTVAGAELSTRCDDDDVHVLGLFLDPAEPELVARLASMREARGRRGEAMVEKLSAIGLPLDLGKIRDVVGDGAFGRPHVARAMVEAGYVRDFQDAFDRYLSRGRAGYVPKPKWTLPEAIGSIRRAGGLAVIAHPVWYTDPEKVVAQGCPAGLDGLETLHVDHSAAKESEFTRLAARYRLLVSAGSDFHAPGEGRPDVGARRLPEEAWNLLVAAASKRREEAGRPPLDVAPR
jgi:predicted metal-dependent phosphoesterase TrpH